VYNYKNCELKLNFKTQKSVTVTHVNFHMVLLVSHMSHVLHLSHMSHVTCSISKFSKGMYSSTPPEFSDLLGDFDKDKFLKRIKKNSV
jgi:hypothetical protein